MQASEGQPEAQAIKAVMMKESLAERLEHMAASVDRTGMEAVDRLHDAAGSGVRVASDGLRRAAEGVREMSIPDFLSGSSKGQGNRTVTLIAAGLGAGLAVGLFVKKMVR